jgi:acetyltransferase
MTDPSAVARTLGRDLKGKSFPVFTTLMGGVDVDEGRRILNTEGIPTFETPERAVRAFAVLCDYARNVELLHEIPSRLPQDGEAYEVRAARLIHRAMEKKNGFLPEVEAKQLLSAYGIPVNRTEPAGSAEEAADLSAELGFPLVMKILSPDISHKTDAGGIRRDLHNPEDVRDAFGRMTETVRSARPDADIQGVTLQPMIQNPDIELLIGAKYDDQFGPVILFGLGGIFTEVVGDRNIGLPPLNRVLARRLMEKTRAFKLLQGYRSLPPADMERLEQLLVGLSHLLVDFPEIAELDMNPVIIKDGAPVAVDARISLQQRERQAPNHLVISPYPEQYECGETTAAGIPLFIRPIKPEDAPMLADLFDSLSPASRYQRFFSPMKHLSRDMLVRLTQIDYDRHICLAALGKDGEKSEMRGVARVISGPDRRNAEFSVVVGDQWQGKGVGRKLLERCLDAGRDYGIGRVFGEVLPENRQMLNLGRELGFDMSRHPEAGTFRLSIALQDGES